MRLDQPTRFWRGCIPEIEADFELFGMENFYAHPSSSRYYAPLSPHSELERQARIVQAHAPHLLTYSQSLYGRPFDPFLFEGRHYSATSLNYLRGLAFLHKTTGIAQIGSALEIGGGFGALGEILLQLGAERYIDVDIEPLSHLARDYLQHLPGAKVQGPTDPFPDHVQLAVNYISFQEMEPDVVAAYAERIVAMRPEFILLRNSRQGKSGVDQRVTAEHYREMFSPYRVLAADVDTFGDRYAELESEVLILC